MRSNFFVIRYVAEAVSNACFCILVIKKREIANFAVGIAQPIPKEAVLCPLLCC